MRYALTSDMKGGSQRLECMIKDTKDAVSFTTQMAT